MAVRFYKNWPQTFPLITCHLFNALQHTGIPAVCPTSETTMLAVVPVWNIPPLNTHGSHSCSSFWFLSWPRLPVRVLRETEPNSLLVCVCVCVCVCVWLINIFLDGEKEEEEEEEEREAGGGWGEGKKGGRRGYSSLRLRESMGNSLSVIPAENVCSIFKSKASFFLGYHCISSA